jgi:hypothetical protein
MGKNKDPGPEKTIQRNETGCNGVTMDLKRDLNHQEKPR